MKLSRREAIREVIEWRRVDKRMSYIRSVTDNGLLRLG